MAIKQPENVQTGTEEFRNGRGNETSASRLVASPLATATGQVIAAQPTAKLVRRKQEQDAAFEQDLARRRWGAILMASVSIGVLAFRRLSYDSVALMVSEGFVCLGCLMAAGWLQLTKSKQRKTTGTSSAQSNTALHQSTGASVLMVVAVVFPWLFNIAARRLGYGNGAEIIMLGSLAWGGVAAALVGGTQRTISLSVICSGFLTLFTTFIADSAQATLFAYAWGVLCLWWLVSNHWEQVESTAATSVRPAQLQRFTFLIVGSLAFAIGAGVIANRVPVLRKLQAEIMPTSGGTTQKDSVSRSGVGNGDALVAAKNHASSFGAVETDLFLDSEKPSLFDVFSDEFGDPKKKDRVEQAQALSPNDTRSDEGQFSEANRASGGDEFSVQREAPKQPQSSHDLASEALMYWEGEAGAHLAVERFADFDGYAWFNAANGSDKSKLLASSATSLVEPRAIEVDGRTWMLPRQRTVQNSISPFIDALPEAIKFTRYRSPIIPTRAGIQLWSVDQLTRTDFFDFSNSECLSMPGRAHVPDYTVVRMVNSRIDMERLQDLLSHCAPGKSHTELQPACQQALYQLAHELAGGKQRGWPEVRSVIDGLRSQFNYERSPEGKKDTDDKVALTHFIKNKRGPSYLFATAAALMLEHLGYETRFVTGFYANPTHYLARDREYAIQSSDAHTWIEIHAGHGYWIPLEPTPGFRIPRYSASLWFRLNEAHATILWSLTGFVTLGTLLYCLRRTFLELLAFVLLPLVSLLNDRQRIGWLTWMIDKRLRMAGHPRRLGVTPRAFLKRLQIGMPDGLGYQLEKVLEAADRITFGHATALSNVEREAISRVWRGATANVLRRGILSTQSGSN